MYAAIFTGQVRMTSSAHWLLATIGNIAGGITFVTLANFRPATLED
ncbi:MAG TPA: hypothetical protein VFU86_19695 [Terriglobales bacterium]|nr:hypothetical protein [Terriglobales bacterium]